MEKGVDPEYEIWKRNMAKAELRHVNFLFNSLNCNIECSKIDIENLEEIIRKWHKRIQDKT